MYASQMVNGCPLPTWKSNSIIVHAVSSNPVGPYIYRDTVMGHFAHNPHVQKVPGASPPLYVIYHIGCALVPQEVPLPGTLHICTICTFKTRSVDASSTVLHLP